MSSHSTAYTPLETLLLFQALRNSTQIDSSLFNQISTDLKHIPLVTHDPSYDAGRLSPDALRELYIWLLKEEAKGDLEKRLEAEDALKTNGDVHSAGSRKRKAPSPGLPSVNDAANHTHLIPQLVARLYARYREVAVKQIREQERRYETLSGEIEEIEQGLWDERLQAQKSVSATNSPQPSTHAHAQDVHDIRSNAAKDEALPSNGPVSSPQAQSEAQPKRYSQATIDAIVNHGPDLQTQPTPNGAQQHRRTSSGTSLPPLSEMAPQSPHFSIPPKVSLQHHAAGNYQPSPPHAHGSSYAQHHGHPAPHMQSPQLPTSMSRSSASPRPILPPPPGMQFSQPSPQHQPSPHASPSMQRTAHVPAQQQYVLHQQQQQYQQQRHPSGSSPAGNLPGGPYQQTPIPAQGAYYQPSPPPQYGDRRPSYTQNHALQQPPQYAHQPMHPGGYMLPPFQVASQEPAKTQAQQQTGIPQGQTQQPQYANARSPQQPYLQQQQRARPYTPHPAPGGGPQTPGGLPPQHPATVPRLQPALSRRMTEEILPKLGTPPRRQPLTPGGRERPLWKSEREEWPVNPPGSPTQPLVEPLSPVQVKARPVTRRSLSPGRGRRGRPRRSTSAQANEANRPSSRRNVKDEPASPARQDEHEHSESVASPEPSRRVTRGRKGTLQSLPTTSQKRKASIAEPSASPTPEPAPPSTVPHDKVLATKNFAKMTTVMMNDINSHKHGSRFALPVRDRDATGYSEIIKRPQDLKSIRSAITAGSRAVAAATAGETPGANDSATVELDKTEELIPPRAIVNGAQLEKEIMRMFANAVMFNPGEDGMVTDTREMFEDVEAKLRDWRGAGVNAPGASADEDAMDVDEGKGKRKKA